MVEKINTSRFYHEWKGHNILDIAAFHSITLSQRPSKPIIYLLGDSSFDNKYWVPSSGPAGEPLPVPVPDIYYAALNRPQPKPDIAFWLNHFLGDDATTLNLAVEASTLRDRDAGLLEHDEFVRDNIRAEDILIVSVGANDIALKPTLATARHMLQLAWLTTHSSIQAGTAWSLSHFTEMFKGQVEAYIYRLVEKQKPRAVIVCMIYYPLEAGNSMQTSWADVPLKLLRYNRHPGQLQAVIRQIYELATKKLEIPGVHIVPCALFEALDGKSEGDYTARVEPSAEGGRKVAMKLKGIVESLTVSAEQRVWNLDSEDYSRIVRQDGKGDS
jgi:lysophospholipase L1-like esterase